MELINTLKKTGFSEKEAKIYLAALELGAAPASSIGRRAGENRVTAYTILKQLCQKWFANELQKNNSSHYLVLDPSHLIKVVQERTRNLEDVLPTLMDMANSYAGKPKISFYDDFESIKRVYEEPLYMQPKHEDDRILAFTWGGKVNPQFEEYLAKEFVPKRKNFSIKTRILLHADKPEFETRNKKFKNIVYVDKNLFGPRNQVILYDYNKVWVFMYEDDISAFVIESQSFFDGYKSIFEFFRDHYSEKD